jgi:hypothetical protein
LIRVRRSRAQRDPLGVQAIWSSLGRFLIGNLTTVTQSLRGFTTLLVGLHIAERVAEFDGDRSAADSFLIWEELAAYARCCFHADTSLLLGVRRAALRTGRRSARLSADSADQILGNQKTDGLWGLYTSAARSSGLVRDGSPPRLTAEGQELVHSLYVPLLARRWGARATGLVELVGQDATDLRIERNNRRLHSIADVLSPQLRAEETGYYRRHLIDGGPEDSTHGRQARLAATMSTVGTDAVPGLIARADPGVAERLRDIAAAESVLAPAGSLFSYMLSREGDSLEQIAATIRGSWGDRLDSVAPAAAAVLPASWAPTATALAYGDYETAITELLLCNRRVMLARGDFAPWGYVSGSGKLVVRFRDETDLLPDGASVRVLWRNPYFLPSLYAILRTVEGARRP